MSSHFYYINTTKDVMGYSSQNYLSKNIICKLLDRFSRSLEPCKVFFFLIPQISKKINTITFRLAYSLAKNKQTESNKKNDLYCHLPLTAMNG